MQVDRQLETEVDYVMGCLASWGCGESLKMLEGELQRIVKQQQKPSPSPPPPPPPPAPETADPAEAMAADVQSYVENILLSDPADTVTAASAGPEVSRGSTETADAARAVPSPPTCAHPGEAGGRPLPFPFENEAASPPAPTHHDPHHPASPMAPPPALPTPPAAAHSPQDASSDVDDWNGDDDPGFIRVPLLEPGLQDELWKPDKGRRRPSFRLGGGITAREREALLREQMDGVYAQLQREVATYKAEHQHLADGDASPQHPSAASPLPHDTASSPPSHIPAAGGVPPPSDSAAASDSVLASGAGSDPLGPSENGVAALACTPVSEQQGDGYADARDPPPVQPYDLVQPAPPAPQLEKFSLQVIYEKGKTGFEENQEYPVKRDHVIAGRYQIIEYIGSAAFSHAVQCLDLKTGHYVCVKIIKNSKDFFDQSLDEIKLLQYINRSGDADEHCVLQLYDYFYHKEHLFLVSELLRDNLYEFSKYNRSTGDAPYFTVQRLQKITKQILVALQFIHNLNLIHCDLKPENILIRSFSRCEVKVIDFGSSCFTHDHLSSYIQSRCYRAPEVVLGLPYDQRIDIWSLGAILPELLTGHVLFYNDSLSTMLCRIAAICGPFPSNMLVHARHAHKYVTRVGAFYEDRGAAKKPSVDLLFPRRTTIRRRMGNCQDDLFVDFVTQLLQIDPTKRLTAAQALQHPWLQVDYGPIPKLTG
eukprot:TRINITY_DN2885_c0_g1_i1.p1 TRINITY_DN2885_c0_g1~~TRINITY_DN2885_c0_g1_i1.p1  ORF type:complete len:759 (+),score=251.98 TRINITY_DN2885_c0_g1_i1:155-2278(+)